MRISVYIAMVVGVVLMGCGRQYEAEPVRVVRLDEVMSQFAALDSARQEAVTEEFAPEIDALFQVLGEPDPTIEEIAAWSRSRAVEMFQPAIDSVFPILTRLEHQVGHILYRAERDSLGLPPLRFAAVAWGKPQPIVRVDTVVLIALNHYLGADFEGYSHWDEYRRAEKNPEQLPYDLAAALAATQLPFEMAERPTLLNWMLYEGALVEARMQLVPEARLNLALGYTPDQLEVLEDNTRKIWNEMAARRLIYDTDPATINRLLAAAPSTPLLGGKAPGRAARYIGYKIVKEYLKKHSSTSLPYLLSPQFYGNQQSLIEAGF
ncbi:MAG: hypothetical protein LIP03_03305 [Bacteroidales bacterium]|nr:hypothetical protein [Bacteroidales bacterium]